MSRSLVVPLLLSLAACSEMSMMSDVGVTQGGTQDIGLAREIIANGGIPARDQFTAEGLFSEHDLPLERDACAEVLCPRTAAIDIEPIDGGADRLLVQLGFGTMHTDATFERQPLDLALVVDVSCSMSGEKIEATRDALHTLADQLGDDDRVALVAFDDRSDVRMRLKSMDAGGKADLDRAIDRLNESGGTNIEAGMEDGYQLLQEVAGEPGRSPRLMLFTDAQPNVGGTDESLFVSMARSNAADGIGLSVFGVGLDLGADLAREISEVRGANSFFLRDGEAIRAVFDELDYLVTPVAYDLRVDVTPVAGFAIGRAYGVPLDEADGTVELSAATLFLSSRSGGMGLTFEALDGSTAIGTGVDVGAFALSYETPAGEVVTEDLKVARDDGEPQLGVFVMRSLVDEVHGLLAGADTCEGTLTADDAAARIDDAAVRLRDAAADLGDEPALIVEAELMEKLAGNVRAGGPCNSSEPM